METERAAALRKKARLWRIVGIITFVIGAVLLWERVSYNLHDFYAENFDLPSEQVLSRYELDAPQRSLLASAIVKMQGKDFWGASTDLDQLKATGGPALQVAEWYKTLCMVGLGEKEKAHALLKYYLEQEDFGFKRPEALLLQEQY